MKELLKLSIQINKYSSIGLCSLSSVASIQSIVDEMIISMAYDKVISFNEILDKMAS